MRTIIGLLLLIKSISQMIGVYNNPNSVEFSAKIGLSIFQIKQAGLFEIAVKSPYLFGIIPSNISLHLHDLANNKEIQIRQSLNLYSQRKNMSGERIVPVSAFSVEETGEYQLVNLSTEKFQEKDKLLITPETGYKGFLLIFAILFSSVLFIGGLVMTILSIVKYHAVGVQYVQELKIKFYTKRNK